ncbi:MAG: hypothetical protein M4579_004374 [Chaenotheca gracillima]|nr:MAG: hypothetical protein M4579_004374 [Chaenotheca gracillima]
MGLSKSTRILILLGIDSVFFLVELSIGYAVHSLALVADSFHMLNDVLSLCVGLWAVKVAHQKPSSKRYTYGWQRAETLGALVNGVFLVALCLTIFLEAIQRFAEPQTVSNPKLVLIVGCFGLLSNILGLFLFHDHGHAHGHSHGEAHADPISTAEDGQSHRHEVADETGPIANVLPETIVTSGATQDGPNGFAKNADDESTAAESSVSASHRDSSQYQRHRRRSSAARRRFTSADSISIHPASFRKDIIAQSRLDGIESGEGTESEPEEAVESPRRQSPDENTSLLPKSRSKSHQHPDMDHQDSFPDLGHADHKHSKPRSASGAGHSHSDLNMRGVFLHVLGDALGNIGVIASALFIWLTPYTWRFYSDPLISLVITVIILASAIPLCKAASRILLQAVPAGINVDDIKEDIKQLPGIENCHHLHVWQLSDTKLIASLHVEVCFDFKGAGAARYMQLALAVRQCLHAYGIHSSTIQPEFLVGPGNAGLSAASLKSDPDDGTEGGASSATAKSGGGSKKPSRAGSMQGSERACLLDCGDECGTLSQCCAPNLPEADARKDTARPH